MEEMAFASLEEMRKEESKNIYFLSRVRYAHQMFRSLPDKLDYLEKNTGMRWYPSKFYFWVNKL